MRVEADEMRGPVSSASPEASTTGGATQAPAKDLAMRVTAAACASLTAVLLVTPLDVIKIQMQASASPDSWANLASRASSSTCTDSPRPGLCLRHLDGPSLTAGTSHLHPSTIRVATSAPTLCTTCSPHMLSSLAATWRPEPAPGVFATVSNIIRKERVTALWRGLDTALLLSIPVVSIHIPLYDLLHSHLRSSLGMYSPAVAGMLARAVAVVLTAPLELTRTRKQASAPGTAAAQPGASLATRRTPPSLHAPRAAGRPARSSTRMAPDLRKVLSGLSVKWTGTGATLWRDVPFSGFYWCLTEPIRAFLLAQLQAPASGPQPSAWSSSSSSSSAAYATPHPHPAAGPSIVSVFLANFAAGSVAGGLAAAATTPFDVVKTRLQTAAAPPPAGPPAALLAYDSAGRLVSARRPGTLAVLGSIYRSQGLPGLFTGVGPRSVRAMLACGIVIAGYEGLKLQLS